MFPSDKIMDRQEMQVEETISEMIDLMRDGFFSDMTIICKGGSVETNSILFSTIFPVVGPILENTRAYDNTYVLLIPEIDSNHLVEFLMNVLLKSSFVNAHPSIVNLLKPNVSNPTGERYQENIEKPEEPLTSVCINFVDPKKNITSQSFLDDPIIQEEYVKTEEMDDLLEDLDPMDTYDNVSPDSPVEKKISDDREEFCCSLCGTLCKSKKILKRHALICKGDQFPFKCSECGSGFKYERGLVRHYKEDHAIARPHKCEHCGKTFKRKFCLRNHELGHEEKKFKCEYCDRLFMHLGNMKKHIARMHEKTFSQKSTLATQEVLCQECGKSFKEKSYLELHRLRAHLKVKALKCDFEGCDEKFVYSIYKYRHEEKVHGIVKTYKKTVKCRFGCETTEYKDVRQRNNHEVSIHGRKGERKGYRTENNST